MYLHACAHVCVCLCIQFICACAYAWYVYSDFWEEKKTQQTTDKHKNINGKKEFNECKRVDEEYMVFVALNAIVMHAQLMHMQVSTIMIFHINVHLAVTNAKHTEEVIHIMMGGGHFIICNVLFNFICFVFILLLNIDRRCGKLF